MPEASAPCTEMLNIIFHGTSAFVLDETIRIVIPNVDKYTIVAGTFLNERPLRKGGRYHLKGVKPACEPRARVATDANIFFVGVSLKPSADIFCELELPLPAAFRSLRLMDIDKAWFPDPPPALRFSNQ